MFFFFFCQLVLKVPSIFISIRICIPANLICWSFLFIYLFIYSQKYSSSLILTTFHFSLIVSMDYKTLSYCVKGSHYDVVANKMDFDIVVSEFELQSTS